MKKTIKFTKMEGAGNSFIIIEPVKDLNLKTFTQKVCDQSTGIGADGVLVCEKSKKADFGMRIINADGSEAEMCGNGARCLAVYIRQTRDPKKIQFTLETLAGQIMCEAKGEVANVRLSAPSGYLPDVPIKVNSKTMKVNFLNTGVPHVIVFVHDLDQINVAEIGKAIRNHVQFKPKGTNVNFVEQVDGTLVRNRTYERGVEAETNACGTGSVASAIVTYLKTHPYIMDKKAALMKVQTRNGDILEVRFDINNGVINNVWLKGNTKFIAQGEYYYV
ncbi:MAG: diaminopimelate epimerase [Candidatus Omnitrophica bacterium]|nr:diaminopimelate epimerase [Candidatus Omnitrophota bacterium]